MRKNNKGFTLIELLAVIIILAIIALITTHIILNVVNDARKSAAEDKAWGAIDATRLAYTQNQSKDDAVTIPDAGLTVTFPPAAFGTTSVKVSGEKPTGGTVTISKDGVITATGLLFTGYSCGTTNGTTMTCTPR